MRLPVLPPLLLTSMSDCALAGSFLRRSLGVFSFVDPCPELRNTVLVDHFLVNLCNKSEAIGWEYMNTLLKLCIYLLLFFCKPNTLSGMCWMRLGILLMLLGLWEESRVMKQVLIQDWNSKMGLSEHLLLSPTLNTHTDRFTKRRPLCPHDLSGGWNRPGGFLQEDFNNHSNKWPPLYC